jgi:hypothetical protein
MKLPEPSMGVSRAGKVTMHNIIALMKEGKTASARELDWTSATLVFRIFGPIVVSGHRKTNWSCHASAIIRVVRPST